jgi:hypothetical protein
MKRNLQTNLPPMELRNAKAEIREVQKLNPEAGDALDQARKAADIEPKQMAGTMRISESLVHRALKSNDDIGFHRLWELSDDFWAELIVAIAKRRRVAVVKTTIEMHGRQKRSA